jgi:hypothetical protein
MYVICCVCVPSASILIVLIMACVGDAESVRVFGSCLKLRRKKHFQARVSTLDVSRTCELKMKFGHFLFSRLEKYCTCKPSN